MKYLSAGLFLALVSLGGVLSAPIAVIEARSEAAIESRGGPGSSSWPPSWMKSSEEKPALLIRGGPGSSSWPPSWLKSDSKSTKRAPISGRGGPGSSSWPPSWMKASEDKPALLTRGGPGSSSWPPSWLKTSSKSESEPEPELKNV